MSGGNIRFPRKEGIGRKICVCNPNESDSISNYLVQTRTCSHIPKVFGHLFFRTWIFHVVCWKSWLWLWLLSLQYASTINSLTAMGSGGNEKLPPCGFPAVGIVRAIRQTTTQLPPQTSSPWCSVFPPYGVDSMNHPNPMHGRPS